MAYGKRQMLTATFAILAGAAFPALHPGVALADDLPPGVTIAAKDGFAPPQGLGAFQAMTFVIDIAPGAGFPAHSHPGRSQVMIVKGDLTEDRPGGQKKVYHAGDAFMEEPDQVHSVSNKGSEAVRLVWTLLLPDGKQPIIPHKD